MYNLSEKNPFIKPVFFWETWFYSYIYIHLQFNPIIYLHPAEEGTFISDFTKYEPNQRSDRLGKIFLTSLVGNHWATGGLRVNSSSVKGGLIIFPLFLLEENAILPMTPRADCAPPILWNFLYGTVCPFADRFLNQYWNLFDWWGHRRNYFSVVYKYVWPFLLVLL